MNKNFYILESCIQQPDPIVFLESTSNNLFSKYNVISEQNGVEVYCLDKQLLQEFRIRMPKLNFKKIVEKFKNSTKALAGWLKKQGVKMGELFAYIKKLTAKMKKMFARIKPGISKKEAKNISNDISKSFVQEIKSIKSMSFLAALGESILVFVIVLVVNSVVYAILVIIVMMFIGEPTTAGIIAMAITAVIVAPFTEEVAKYHSIKNDYPWIYVTIFAWAELLMYVSAGVPFLIRLFPLAMHYSTTLFQILVRNYRKEQGDDEETSSKAGLYVGIAIHSLWNSLATLSSVI